MDEEKYKSGYKNLVVWKKADELALAIYFVTKKFPRDEIFGLVSQMRRCAVSVPANIAEGYGRRTAKDRTQFYYISSGSLNELEYYIDFSCKLEYISVSERDCLCALRNDVGRLLYGFINSQRS